jgi:transcription elongation factor Elf1
VSDDAVKNGAVSESDMVFDCPYCSKSLAIDERGAGLIVTCPDCNNKIQAPIPTDYFESDPNDTVSDVEQDPRDQQIQELAETLAASQSHVQRLVESLREMTDRRNHLENLRVQSMKKFEAISKDLTVMQAAFDRVVSTLQDTGVEYEEPDES